MAKDKKKSKSEDIVRSGLAGLLQGGAGLVDAIYSIHTLPSGLGRATADIYNKYSKGQPVDVLNSLQGILASPARDAVGKIGGNYDPETSWGDYAKSIGSLAPSLLAPGGLLTKGAMVLGGGIGGQAANDAVGLLTNDPAYKDAGRFAGSLLGMLTPGSISNLAKSAGRTLKPNLGERELAKTYVVAQSPKYYERLKPQLEARDVVATNKISQAVKPYEKSAAPYASKKEALLEPGKVDLNPVKDYLKNYIAKRKGGTPTENVEGAQNFLNLLKGKGKNPLSLDDVRDTVGRNLSEKGPAVTEAYGMLKNQIDKARPGYEELLKQGREAIIINDLATEFQGALAKGSTSGEHLKSFSGRLAQLKSDLAKSHRALPEPFQNIVDTMDDYMSFYKSRGGSLEDMGRRAYRAAETRVSPVSESDLTKPLGIFRRTWDTLGGGNMRRWNAITEPAPGEVGNVGKVSTALPATQLNQDEPQQVPATALPEENIGKIPSFEEFYAQEFSKPKEEEPIIMPKGVPSFDEFYQNEFLGGAQ